MLSIAHEIGLHHTIRFNFPAGMSPGVVRQYELELLDRERTYRCCFIHDRILMSQAGKPDSVLVSAERSTRLTLLGNAQRSNSKD